MPRFLVIHRIRRIYESQDALIEDWRGLRQRSLGDARWLRSLYCASTQKLYCEWEAEGPEAIRACLAPKELEMAPIEGIEEAAFLDPAWLD